MKRLSAILILVMLAGISSAQRPSNCNVYFTYPFLETFSNPYCWSLYCNPNNGLNALHFGIGADVSGVYDDNWLICFSSIMTAEDYTQYAISPLLNDLQGHTLKISFEYWVYSSEDPESFVLMYSTAGNSVSDFVECSDEIVATNTLEDGAQSSMVIIPAEARYFAFKYTSQHAKYLYIDNVGFAYDALSTNLPTVSISSPNRITVGEEIQLWASISSAMPVTGIQWESDNAVFQDNTSQSAMVYWTTAGSHEVAVHVSNANGTTTATKTIEVVDCDHLISSYPYEENFTYPSCWTLISANAYNIVNVGYTEDEYGERAYIEFQSNEQASDYTQWAITPMLTNNDTYNIEVSFNYYCYNPSREERFIPMYSITDTDVESFVPVATEVIVNNSFFSPETYNIEIPAEARYFAIKYTSNNATYLVIDNITFSLGTVSTNPPIVSITSPEYARTDELVTLDAFMVSSHPITNRSWIINGATPSTANTEDVDVMWTQEGIYTFSASATNVNGTTTANGSIYVIDCEQTLSDYPFTETFEHDMCWSFGSTFTSNLDEAGIARSVAGEYEDNCIVFSSMTSSYDTQWAISHELGAHSGNLLDVSFDYFAINGTESFQILYSETNTSIENFIPVDGEDPVVTYWPQYGRFSCSLPATARYLAIKYSPGRTGRLYIDNVQFALGADIYTVPQVTVTAPQIDRVGDEVTLTANIQSVAEITSINWNITGSTPSSTNTATTTAIWNVPGTYSYSVTVANANGPTTVSGTIRIVECDGYIDTYSYLETFDFSDCWTFIANTEDNTDVAGIGLDATNLYLDNAIVFSSANPSPDYIQYAVSPRLNNHPINMLNISFNYATSGETEKFCVLYSTTTADIENMHQYSDEITVSDSLDNFQTFYCTLPAETKYFAIKYTSCHAGQLYIDNVLFSLGTDASELPHVTIIAPQSTPQNTQITVSAQISSIAAVTSVEWTFNGAQPSTASGETVNVSWPDAGTYSYSVAVANYNGTTVVDASIDVLDCETGIMTYPYSESFDYLSCWTFVPADGDNVEYSGIGQDLVGAYGNNAILFSSFYYSDDFTQYAISPLLNNHPNNMIDVSFECMAYNVDAGPETFIPMYSTTTSDVSSFISLGDVISVNSTAMTRFECTIPANAKYFAIKYLSEFKFYLYVDNFVFTLGDFVVSTPVTKSETVEVYPNPAADIININAQDSYRISIVNILGSIIYESDCSENCIVDVSHYARGTYFIKIDSENYNITKKIVLE